jgi:hypothetical protein
MTQPDWANAPHDATHALGFNSWYKKVKGYWLTMRNGNWGSSYNSTEYNDTNLVPRPTPQWRGPQDGLPPVGTVCRVTSHNYSEGAVVAHLRDEAQVVLVALQMNTGYVIRSHHNLRPQVPMREIFIETMLTHMDPPICGQAGLRTDLGKLFDKGVRLRGGV